MTVAEKRRHGLRASLRLFALRLCQRSLLVAMAAPIATQGAASTEVETCLLDGLSQAEATTTVQELREICTQTTSIEMIEPKPLVPTTEVRGAVAERRSVERGFADQPFTITAHQPNFLMTSYSDNPNQTPFIEIAGDDSPVEDSEVVFQVSVKAPVWRNVFGRDLDMYAAYTAKSWWQLYADDFSAPFRETNYQPELFVRGEANIHVFGTQLVGWDFGFNHESNGRSDPLSRSWNRLMARAAFQVTEDVSIFARTWYRLPEDDDDNNPNEYRYYGYGDVRAIWTPNQNTFTALIRPGTDKFSYQLTWSRSINSVFRVYAEYYNGYGENLLDYDHKNRRFGIGIAINDFLENR